MGILSVQHDRPAIAEVKFDHILYSLTANLEPDGIHQGIRTHIRCEVLEKAGADAGKAVDSALDIFVRDKAILVDKHEDMTTHFCKVNFFQSSRSGPASGGVCEVMAKHHTSCGHFGVTMDEMDSEFIVHIVFDLGDHSLSHNQNRTVAEIVLLPHL